MLVTCFLPEIVYSCPEVLVDVKVDCKARVWINGREGAKFFIPLEYGKNRIEICAKSKTEFKKIEHWITNLKKEEHEFELQDGYVTLMEICDAFHVKTEWIPQMKVINLFFTEDVYSLTINKDTLTHNNVVEHCEPVLIRNNKAMISAKTCELFGFVSEFQGKIKITRFS